MRAALLLSLSFFLCAGEGPKSWTPELHLKVRGIQAVRPSPGGSQVAFTVTEPVMSAEKSEYLTQIWIGGAAGSRQLTFGEKSSTDPRWSPDGKRLAFISPRSGKGQIYVLPMEGGEAEAITEAKSDIAAYAWSPDGTRFAFTMLDPKTEDEEKAAKGKDDARWAQEKPAQRRLYVIAVAKDKDGKREAKKLTLMDRSVEGFDWSPDSKTIVFAHVRNPGANEWPSSDLAKVDVASSNVQTLAATTAAEANPHFSPDGKRIAFSLSDDPPSWPFHSRVALLNAQGGTAKALAETPDGQPLLHGWTREGRLLLSEAKATATGIYLQSTEDGQLTEWPVGPRLCTALELDASGCFLGFAMQTAAQPGEAFLTSIEGFKPAQISKANAELLSPPLPRTELIHWTGAKGQAIEGLLTYPVGYEGGQKVPLILNVHGGPAGVFLQSFVANPGAYPIASFAAKGIAVLRPNPRGSSGYGFAFRNANHGDWGGADYEDLMKGVDKVIAMGVADPTRLGVMGWSYGGFMTSWIITQTQRFKAASVGAAVTNLESFNGTTDIPDFIPDYFGGQAWDNEKSYRTHGSMTAVKNVKTPALIQHCEGDARVPIGQGYEFFNALKHLNVETRMLILPRQAHSPTEPKALLKVMKTNLDWFTEKLLK